MHTNHGVTHPNCFTARAHTHTQPNIPNKPSHHVATTTTKTEERTISPGNSVTSYVKKAKSKDVKDVRNEKRTGMNVEKSVNSRTNWSLTSFD